MKYFSRTSQIISLVGMICLFSSYSGGSTCSALPEAIPSARFQNVWCAEKNPFLRQAPPPGQVPAESWARDWSLAGIYKSTDGVVSVFLKSKTTGMHRQIQNNDANDRFQIVEARLHRNRDSAQVTLSLDGVTADFGFEFTPAMPAPPSAVAPPSISKRRALITPPQP